MFSLFFKRFGIPGVISAPALVFAMFGGVSGGIIGAAPQEEEVQGVVEA